MKVKRSVTHGISVTDVGSTSSTISVTCCSLESVVFDYTVCVGCYI